MNITTINRSMGTAAVLLGLTLAGSVQALPGTYTTSWVGASSATTPPPMQAMGLSVGPDGTCYTNQSWDESGPNGSVFKNDGTITDINLNTLGDGAVAYNGSLVYGQNGHNGFQSSNPAGGTNTGPVDAGTRVDGIAATGTEVFVSCPDANLIKVYDAGTLSFKRQFTINKPHRSVAAPDGTLWVVEGTINRIEIASDTQNSGDCSIVHIDSNGNLQKTITSGVQRPRGLAISSDGNTLYTADDGTDQCIKKYTSIKTTPAGPTYFTTQGGVFAGSGASIGTMGPGRMNHPTGVGVDTSGNVYTSEWASYTGGGLILSKYNSSGARQWVVYGLCFEDGIDFDPATDGQDAFDKARHYKLDLTQPPGQEWSVVGYTHNRYKYSQDMRNDWFLDNPGTAWVKEIQGHKLLFIQRQTRGDIQIFRFNSSTDGETAIPCGVIADIHEPFDDTQSWPNGGLSFDGLQETIWGNGAQPAIPSGQSAFNLPFIWNDLNGDAIPEANEFTQPSFGSETYTDTIGNNGDLWLCDAQDRTLRKVPFGGFTSAGVPEWNYAQETTYNTPAPYASNGIDRMEYDSAHDVMYVSGYPDGGAVDSGNWIGDSVTRYNNWSANAGNWTAAWTSKDLAYDYTTDGSGNFTYNTSTHVPQSMCIAGNYVFVAYFGGSSPGGVRVLNQSNGVSPGTLTPNSGWTTYDDDMIYGVRAFQRSTGEYLVSLDEHAHARIVFYRWNDGTSAPTVATPTFSPGGGSYTGTQSVTLSDSTSGATIYYTTNGTTPTTSSTKYTGAISVAGTETIEAIGVATGDTNSAVASATYTISAGSGEAAYNGPHNIPGTIQNEDYDTGGEGVAYHDTDASNDGGQYRTSDGVDIETTTDTGGGYDVGWTAAGEYLKYTVVVATSGTYTVTFRVAAAAATGTTAGTLHLSSGSTNLTGTVNIPGTGGWQTWTNVTATVTLAAGTQILTLNEDSGGYNLNFMTFASSGGASGSLAGSGVSTNGAAATINLTTTGGTDWAQWGMSAATDFNHKSSGGTKISNFTEVGSGTISQNSDNDPKFSWTDGTPTVSNSGTTGGVFLQNGVGNGYSFTVPADTTSRTLKVYVYGWSSVGQLNAHLSDSSAADYNDSTAWVSNGNGNFYACYTLTYKAASAGKTLTVKWTLKTDNGFGAVGLQAAAIQ